MDGKHCSVRHGCGADGHHGPDSGMASARMAGMGPILGWPLFMSVIIITSNVWGFMTGEWKGAGSKALAVMLGGIFFLILGFCTLAYAGKLG